MRVFYTGFNLYQQFNKSPLLLIENFTDSNYHDCVDILVSHTFSLIVNNKSEVIYHGCKQNTFVLPQILKMKQLACSDNKVVLLSEDGLLYKLDTKDLYAKPLLQHMMIKFVRIACGSKITVALTQDFGIYNLPNKLNFESKDIVSLETGCEHCLLLSQNGDVYSFGCGSRGQLGHGNLENEAEPQLINALAGIKIIKIAAGGWHSCAVSADGDLYIWGWNGNGQLGLYNDDESAISVLATPQVVNLFDESDTVISVACGNRHTVILLDSGKLFGTGWNKYHQLGNINGLKNDNIYKMSFLKDFSFAFSDLKNVTVKCGPWATLVIIY